MKRNVISIIAGFIFITFLELPLLHVRNASAESIPSDAIAFMRWSIGTPPTDQELKCLVTKNAELGDQLDIFQIRPEGDTLIYSHKPGDHFVSMFTTGTIGGDLMSIWVGGSAFHFFMFSYSGSRIHLIFEEGGYLMPELINMKEDIKPAIITVTDMVPDAHSIMQPANANIYRWNGKQYYLFKATSSWRERLKLLLE